MPHIRIYTTRSCPFCKRAKALITRKGFPFEEIDVEAGDLWDWLARTTGQKTVPQIFVGDRPLGGFSDIAALDGLGRLDPILRGEGAD